MKFCGNVGFVYDKETESGLYEHICTERRYYGDVLQNIRRWTAGDKINDDITLNNKLSIIADSFVIENVGAMKYVDYLGSKWKIESAEVLRPRIILTLGGVYNADQT